MRKLFPVAIVALVITFGSLGCSPVKTSTPGPDVTQPSAPKYTAAQVISKAAARGPVGMDSHVEWIWTAEYLPAQPDLKLNGVWKLEQNGVNADNNKVNQVWYFHEDTGTFTYSRDK